jgi:hypothetical protein
MDTKAISQLYTRYGNGTLLDTKSNFTIALNFKQSQPETIIEVILLQKPPETRKPTGKLQLWTRPTFISLKSENREIILLKLNQMPLAARGKPSSPS